MFYTAHHNLQKKIETIVPKITFAPKQHRGAHYPELEQAHRSHVINVRHVTSFSNTEVTFHCGKKVAMSKTYAPKVIEAILNWKKG